MTAAGAGEVARGRARQPPSRGAMLALASLISLHGGTSPPWARAGAPCRRAPSSALSATQGSLSWASQTTDPEPCRLQQKPGAALTEFGVAVDDPMPVAVPTEQMLPASAAPAASGRAKGGRGRPGVRMCEQDGCHLVAKFGDPSGGGPVKCRTHKLPSHRILRGWTPCLHAEGCTQKSSFGFPFGRPIYCQAHKTSAHVSLSFRGRKCLFHGCPKQPSFGSPVDGRIRFCQLHKGVSDVFLRSVRCRHPEGCLKGATFASPGCKVPTACAMHRRPDHVRLVGVQNHTSLAQMSVCPRCLQKISRRNMAKHRARGQCRARAATIKHKRSRMGRDVMDALKGRKGRRHPTLCETPALHAENFMDNVADASTACPGDAPLSVPSKGSNCSRPGDVITPPHPHFIPLPASGVVLQAELGLRPSGPGTGAPAAPMPMHQPEFGETGGEPGLARTCSGTALVAQAGTVIEPWNQTSVRRQPGMRGGWQLRHVAMRCHKCVTNKRTAAYCGARKHEVKRPAPSPCGLSDTKPDRDAPADERKSIYLGVGWSKQKHKWRARLGHVHVGFFDDEHEAAEARERHRVKQSLEHVLEQTASKERRARAQVQGASRLVSSET
jgi:hypothetical protein